MQIGWTTVFLAEYAGPLFVYLWFYRSRDIQSLINSEISQIKEFVFHERWQF